MKRNKLPVGLYFLLFLLCTASISCNAIFSKDEEVEKDIVIHPAQLDPSIASHIEESVSKVLSDSGRLSDSIYLQEPQWVGTFYEANEYKPIWSSNGVLHPLADSLFVFIKQANYYGLISADYHFKWLDQSRKDLIYDSLAMKDAVLWSKADVLMTDAFFHLSRHIKHGRLPFDSLSLRSEAVLRFGYVDSLLKMVQQGASLQQAFATAEPYNKGYLMLKSGLKHFLDSIGPFKVPSLIDYPIRDSIQFKHQLMARLREAKLLTDTGIDFTDTAAIKEVISKFQRKTGLPPHGKITGKTIEKLNENDWGKFISIAINLDRYKLLPDTMPQRFIWVNIPAYSLQVWDTDTIRLISKVIVGKPETRTPKLTSKVVNMLTYPQWTIPNSIIAKEILPAAKKDPGYFKRKGFMVLGAKGVMIDPYTVSWGKYKKGIPYQIVQGSGDDNALGVLKFNFSNRYSVYMHDTNQRYLFQNADRSMSHGCVRVESWAKLADYLLQVDSASTHKFYEGPYPPADSLKHWLRNKEKHYLYLKNRVPLFIRYFTCEGKDGKVNFYRDIYKEDSVIKMTIFKNNQIAVN